MSDQVKPAPTAAEIAEARAWFVDAELDSFSDIGFPDTARHIRTLLAALDAAEARADTAEKDAAVNEKFYVETCASLSRERTRALTAERERDEARAALEHREERLREALDRGNKWEAASHEAEARIAELAAKIAGAIVVADTEATVETIERAICSNLDAETYMEQARAVLAALREASR